MTALRGTGRYDEIAKNFAQISNAAAQDRRLSGLARAIILLVLSMPPERHLTTTWLDTQFPDSQRAVRRALDELEKYGYYRKSRKSGGRGRWIWEQVVTDDPSLLAETSRTPREGSANPSANPVTSTQGCADELTCDDTEFPQVVSSARFTSDVNTSDVNRADKNVNTEEPKYEDQNQKMASRRAHASSASESLNDSQKISGVRAAVAAVYGSDQNDWLSDAECLDLFEAKKPKNRKVGSVEKYMAKIFEDTPDLNTHLVGLGDDDLSYAEAERERVINGDTAPWACPRCGGTTAAPAGQGCCAWCAVDMTQDAIVAALRERCGYDADEQWARKVYATIFGSVDPAKVGDRAAYAYGAIMKDKDPKRFTPTPTPAPYRRAA